MEYNST